MITTTLLLACLVAPPAQLGRPGLWLDAGDLRARHGDGQVVDRWPDKSGNGFDAVYEPRVPQASRTVGRHNPPRFETEALNGHPAVAFDARDRDNLLLCRAGHLLGQGITGFSAAFVVRPALRYGPPPAAGVAWKKDRYLFITHVSNYNTRFSVQIVQDTGEVKFFLRPGPAQQRVTQLSSFAEGRRVAAGEAWHRLLVTADYKEKVARLFLDGTMLTYRLPADSLGSFEDIPSPITGIGSSTLGDWLTFKLAELICYEKALSPDELRGLDGYLVRKYALDESK